MISIWSLESAFSTSMFMYSQNSVFRRAESLRCGSYPHTARISAPGTVTTTVRHSTSSLPCLTCRAFRSLSTPIISDADHSGVDHSDAGHSGAGHSGADRTQLFQSSKLIMDIATYRLNQPRGQCSENHLKYMTRWNGRDGVTITIFFQYTIKMVGN